MPSYQLRGRVPKTRRVAFRGADATLHPEGTIGAEATGELAATFDTLRPLRVAEAAPASEDPEYPLFRLAR
jgi:hypothetical protein